MLCPFIPPFTRSTLNIGVVLEAGTTKESKGQRICSRNSIPVEEMDKEIVHYNKHTMIRALAQGWPLGA